MNDTEFRREIINYIGASLDEFCEYKVGLLEMFRVFHAICRDNDFHYYYGFGSLLGIVRDDGMIPWDADIDVLVPINRAEMLIRILKDNLPKDYYIVSNFLDPNYYLCETRICRRGYNSDVFHIDIFYIIGAPEDEKKRRKFDKKVKRYYYNRTIRYKQIERGETSRDRLVYYAKKAIRFFMRLKPDFIFNRECDNLLFKYNYEKATYCIVWAVGGEIFPISIFEPVKKYQKDDFECLLPQSPDAFLRIRYGEYWQYLPVQDRFEEFYHSFKRFQSK